ncbi:metalloendopeptidase [Aliidongia dinghuensis]|uniref:Metalloendopeptidase n=1 Tax=Aliidongia dinghuensis TaxID=1867774 RepID=A0A8J2YXJ6_9PROT|nr:M48 family metallopeptidase [Aliidongia dinghuensis]GGF36881.1 metalloendopeptidase [Aliidongia dinghuensis]
MRGRLFDGRTSAAHEVRLVVDPDAGLLRFEPEAAEARGPDPWPLAQIRTIERTASGARLGVEGIEGARLQLGAEARDYLAPHCPNLRRRPRSRWSGVRVALWCVLAIVGLGATLFVLLPMFAHQAALVLPRGIDRQLGESSERGFASMLGLSGKPVRRCMAPAGLAALDRLTARLAQAGGLPETPRVVVLDSRVINAFALPGERILLLSGVINRAENAPAVAGILGHEMGHIAHHDPTEALVRNAGMGLLVGIAMGDIFGGSSAGIATLMLTRNAYSREAERAADGFALRALATAGIDAMPLGRFYGRIAREQAASGVLVPSLLSTHPDPGDRQARVEREGRPGDAAMSNEDWKAFLGICDELGPIDP